MAIITISRGSYSKGKEVAEKVGARLGYRCVSREVILGASDRFSIPEIRMEKAIHDAPSILERLGRSKHAYVAFYQSALTLEVLRDNVVYHGLAGHLLLKGVPHVLKVRVIADLDDRVRSEMIRGGMSEKEARSLILKDDQERRKWTQALYGADPWDSALYDLVVHINKFTVDDAVDFVCRAAQLEHFQATRESQQKLEDLALANQVKASLIEHYNDFMVKSDYGNIVIYTKIEGRNHHKLEKKAKELVHKIEGINNIEVHAGVPAPLNAV
jgi:cytidylate kinase